MAGKLYSAALAQDENGTLLKAAANPFTVYNEGHMLVVGDYDPVLHDYLKRDFSIGVKVNSVRSSGYPHVYNEQTKLPNNTKAVDPKIGFGTAGNPSYRPTTLDADYGRDSWKTAFPRAYVTGIRYTFFDRSMEQDYGAFENLIAKDTNDMMTDFVKTTANDFWNGTTPLDSTTAFTYCGVLSQVTDKTAIAGNTTIVGAIQTKVASLMARLDYTKYPDVIAMNPATYDLLVKEEEARQIYTRPIEAEIVPGVKVPGIYTPVAVLPVVLTPFIKPEVAGGKTTHSIVALNTSMIDRVWLFNESPTMYEVATPENPLGNNGLMTDKFILNFENYVVHGASSGAHFILTKEV